MDQIVEKILKYRVIAIVRGADEKQILSVAQALCRGGIRLAEITFDATGRVPVERTAEMIRMVKDAFAGQLSVGAGTVLTGKQLAVAAEAGAEYIISPNTDPVLIRKTKKLGLGSIPGAMTPSECVAAHTAGADLIKLFPMKSLGLSYYQALSAPLSHIRFLAVGGIDAEHLQDYLKAGVCGVGIGSDIVSSDLLRTENYEEISRRAARYTYQIRF